MAAAASHHSHTLTRRHRHRPASATLPLSARPSQGVYAVHVGAFDESAIATFLRGVTARGAKTLGFASLPAVEAVAEWDGKDAEAVEEEFSLAELMGDDVGGGSGEL
jgi:hypothetical protein